MPDLVEQKVKIGVDAYGRLVEATYYKNYDGKVMWRIKSHPVSQRDEGEQIHSLTDENLRQLRAALDAVRR
jgi:hypothetical protein